MRDGCSLDKLGRTMKVAGPDLETPQIESFGRGEVIASGPPRVHPPSVTGVKRRPATEITTATVRRQASY